MNISLFKFVYEYPAKTQPSWSEKVERWYQMDAYAYGLVHAYSELKNHLSPNPELLILASPQSSNETDFNFVQEGASSPSKFVYTLPSVRGTPLLQLMNWHGELLCLQNDPQTWIDALTEALDSQRQSLWVLQARQVKEGAYEVQIADINSSTQRFDAAQVSLIATQSHIEDKALKTDKDFWNWVNQTDRDNGFPLSNGWVLKNSKDIRGTVF